MEAVLVRIVSSPRLRQRFHVQLVSTNGEKLMWSEKYKDRSHARELGGWLAGELECAIEDET